MSISEGASTQHEKFDAISLDILVADKTLNTTEVVKVGLHVVCLLVGLLVSQCSW